MRASPSVTERIDAVEEAYEFLLAYAARGTTDDAGEAGRGVRSFLAQLDNALDGLPAAARRESRGLPADLAAACASFIAVLEDDVARALAAVRLAEASPRAGSQLVDNLNANIHLRAALTDLFLLDEMLGDKGGKHADQT
jgi:hypothetical protein